MTMQTPQKFIGWIEKIFPPTDYDQGFAVANYKDEAMRDMMRAKKDYPQTLRFSANIKMGANTQLDGLHEGDKVQITYYLSGRSGISKAGNYYCFNTLHIAKNHGVELLERSALQETKQTDEVPADDSDVPF